MQANAAPKATSVSAVREILGVSRKSGMCSPVNITEVLGWMQCGVYRKWRNFFGGRVEGVTFHAAARVPSINPERIIQYLAYNIYYGKFDIV